MTGANRFTFDIIANDKASTATSKVTSNVQAMTVALNAGAEAYERMTNAQRRSTGNGGSRNSDQVTLLRMLTQAQQNQERNERRLAEASARRAAQENADAQRRASLVATSAAKEAAAIRTIQSALDRSQASYARSAAAAQSSSAARVAALNNEIARTQALVAAKLLEVQAARSAAQVAQRAASTGSGSLGTGAGDARNSAAAVQALATAHRGLTQAQQANTAAANALAAEQRRVDAANRQLAASNSTTEAQLNTTRYALYQVAAAYTAVGRAALGGGADIAKTAIDFEAAYAQVTRTTGLGEDVRQGVSGAVESVSLLRDSFVQLSTEIPKTFQDLTLIGSLGAQLGIAKADILDFTSVVAKFSATTNVSTEQAAQEFGRLGNLLDVPASKFVNLASSVSYLGTTSVATESEILAVAAQVGAVGTNAGLSAPYVVGLSTALASLRVAPELARGATTRIFSNITRAVADGGEKLDAYAGVLGLTSAAAANLFEQNPEKFFTDLVTSLGVASENGQNLTLILDSLGIKASRDVQVVQRLAGSYQLLGDYTGKAFESFTKGTYLDTSFQDIAETTQAALTEMVNSFSALKDSIGQAFLKPIEVAANALNFFFSMLSKLPSSVTGIFSGVLIAVGVIAAFRAALALAGAAALAFRAAGAQLSGGTITLRSVLLLLNQAQIQTATTAVGATAALRGQAAAMGGVAAAGGAAAASTTAVGVATAGAAASTGLLSGAFGALLRALGPVGLAFIAVGALTGLIGGLFSDTNKAAEAAEKLKQEQDALNQSWQQAGSGSDALQKAIKADTAAYREAAAAGKESEGTYKIIAKGAEELADGTKQATASISDLRTGVTTVKSGAVDAASGFAEYTAAMADATGQTAPTAAGIVQVSDAARDNTIALGEMTKQWQATALFDKLSTLFSGPEMQGALKDLEATQPGLLKDAVAAFLDGGPEAVEASFGKTRDAIEKELYRLNDALEIENSKQAALIDPKVVQETEASIARLGQQYEFLAQLKQQFVDADNAVDQAAAFNDLQNAISGALGIIDEDMTTTNETIKTQEELLQEVRDQYSALVDDIFAVSDAQGALIASFEELGASIADNGTDFSNFTEGGRANLAALQSAVEAFAATQDYAIANQGLSAEQAAANTAAFIQDTMAELSAQGVDTSQLDFLNNYLAQLTGQNYQVNVNADVSGAVANLNFLQGFLNRISGSINAVLGGINRAAGINVAPVSLKAPSAKGAAVPTRASVPTPTLNAALGQGRAKKEAENLEKANKGAGSAAKKAGQAQKDAADQAAEALKKQKEYVKDLAGFYENLASKAFLSVENEGKAFASLQKLGQSLTENGKAFNTVTEDGRKNFSALTDVFDSFGATLSTQISSGALSADQAGAKYREFARGVYGELQSLGVPTQQLSGFFRALGVDATGWTGNSGDVQQYSGFITAAANAVGGLTAKLDTAAEYANELGDKLDKAFDRNFGLEEAADGVLSAMNKIQNAYQDNIDKVKELRDENQGLSADLSSSQADKRKAEIEQAISMKYGETDRAADYGAQAGKAQASIDTTAGKIGANSSEISALEAGRGALLGNTDAAIDNRAALRDLQKQMLDQIEAYAATGATTEEVTRYSEQLRAKFVDVATQAGFTAGDVQRYTGVFQNYINVIRTVPDRITTQVMVNGVGEAINALNAIPRSITSTTYATLDGNAYRYVSDYLNAIPKRGDYTVTPKVDTGAAGAAGAGAGGALGSALGNALDSAVNDKLAQVYRNIGASMASIGRQVGSIFSNLFNGPTFINGNMLVPSRAMGGLAPMQGFAAGGYVPGRAPQDPRVDNLLAQGPGGLFGIRSGEYVVRQPAVQKFGVPFMDALNNGDLPGFARGGSVGGGGRGGTMTVELSPDDRSLLRGGSGGGGVTLLLDGLVLAKSTDKKNAALARKGTG